MEKIELIQEEIRQNGSFSFSRSSGPGGQNVNKLNTNVLLTFSFESSIILSTLEKKLIREKLSGRINTAGELFVQVHEERSQHRNRETAVLRAAELMIHAVKRNPPRKNTKPSKASVERRLAAKKRRSGIKHTRRLPPEF